MALAAASIPQFQHPNPSNPGHPSLHPILRWHNPEFNRLDLWWLKGKQKDSCKDKQKKETTKKKLRL